MGRRADARKLKVAPDPAALCAPSGARSHRLQRPSFKRLDVAALLVGGGQHGIGEPQPRAGNLLRAEVTGDANPRLIECPTDHPQGIRSEGSAVDQIARHHLPIP